MHSVARSVAKKLRLDRIAMAASLPHCAAAARLALPATRSELAELRRGLRDGAAVAAAIPEDDSQNVSFRQVCEVSEVTRPPWVDPVFKWPSSPELRVMAVDFEPN